MCLSPSREEERRFFSEKPSQQRRANMDQILDRLRIAVDCLEFMQLLDRVRGFLNPVEGYALMTMARLGPGLGEIVEIGSFMGKSTCWLATGTKQVLREKVTAVDHFEGSPEHQKGAAMETPDIVEKGSTLDAFKANIKAVGVDDYVDTIVASSEEAAKHWTKPIRLLFIDGDHSYEAARKDFELWSPFVIQGGLVLFHDIDVGDGVTKFYRELTGQSTEYEHQFQVASVAVLQKKKRSLERNS
jgi:predicted O-methyltransferase YrrM